MAIKDVREYYERTVSDYVEMKRVLDELENISKEKAAAAYDHIETIKEQVRLLESNYKRLAYIMYLLNMPKRKEKKKKYKKLEKNKLSEIHEKDTMEGVIKEDSEIIDNLKSYL